VVTGQRLYLFAREENRDAFVANPGRVLKDARERWSDVKKSLSQ